MLVNESPETNVHPVPVLLDTQVTTMETERVRLLSEDGVRVSKPLHELDGVCSNTDWDSSWGKFWNTEDYVDVHTTITTSYLKRPNEECNYDEDSDYEDSDYEHVKKGNDGLQRDLKDEEI